MNMPCLFCHLDITRQKVFAKISKCEFFKKFTTYDGRLITKRVVQIDPSGAKKVKLRPTPRTIRELQLVLGFVVFL